METKGYNGWTNYETWNAALWFDGDFLEEEAANYEDAYSFGKFIESYIDDMVEEAGIDNGFLSDLLGAAVREINCFEIAEHYEEFFKKEGEEEEEEEEEENNERIPFSWADYPDDPERTAQLKAINERLDKMIGSLKDTTE